MKKLQILFLAIVLANSAFAQYSGGSGTSGDPYQIATTGDLITLSNTSADWGDYFIQTANISFDADETQVDWNGDNNVDAADDPGFSPIGNSSDNFTGTYDGQDYEISNLFINRTSTDDVGLFGRTSGLTIENLGVVDCDISGRANVGGLVGWNNDNCNIVNSYSTGAVDGNFNVGGLVGFNNSSSSVDNSYSTGAVTGSGSNVGGLVGGNNSSSTITNSYSTGAVDGQDQTGGLVGHNLASSTVTNSYSTGAVTGRNSVGGLVGFNQSSSSVESSYSTGAVTGSGSNVGGLVGLNQSSCSVENSYSTGAVTGSVNNVGGLVGWNSISTVTNSYSTGAVDGSGNYVGGLVGFNQSSSSIDNSYSTGAVDGGFNVGGLVGWNNNSSIENCYSVGTVSGGGSNIGGFIGQYDIGTLTANYWKEDGSLDDTGGGNNANIFETSDADMKIQSTFSGWDFTSTPIWNFVSGANNDYPVLSWQQYPPPILTNTAITNITSSSASFSTDVFDGGTTTTYTFDYGTSSGNYSFSFSDEVAGNSATVNVGFEDNTNIMANTQYFVRASATNSVGWSQSEEITFTTLTVEPENYPNSFTTNDILETKIILGYQSLTDAEADGYIILSKSGGTFSEVPTDGDNYTVGSTVGTAEVAAIITDVSSVNNTMDDLTKQTQYSYSIFPFNWDGSNITTANYKTDGTPPRIAVTTIPTLGEWGMMVFGGLMLIGGVWQIKKLT